MQIEGLCFGYPGHPLFSNWSACIVPGVTLLRGGDGRGKTTLLRLLAGALQADAGELKIRGISLQSQPLVYRSQVFWIEPRSQAFDKMTAPEYFDSQRIFHPGFDNNMLARLVDGFDLGPHLHKALYMLSSGSQRKVWLAAAFASGAAVTLLDQPFAALDNASVCFLEQLVQDAAAQPDRAWVLAHHEAPGQALLAGVIELGD